MNERLYLIISVCILVATLAIFLYTALILRTQYKLVKIDLHVCKSAVRDLRELVLKLTEKEGERIKRVADTLDSVDAVLNLNDQIIKDNHQLSNELAVLRMEIRRAGEAKEDGEEVIDS